MEHCSGIPGIVYNFKNQNLMTFEDNLGYKGDSAVVAYIDFETATPTDSCFDPEQKKRSLYRMLSYLPFIQH